MKGRGDRDYLWVTVLIAVLATVYVLYRTGVLGWLAFNVRMILGV